MTNLAELPPLPDPDPTLLALDKLAREYDHYEHGLPFMGSGVLGDGLPLEDYDESRPFLDKLRNEMRAYGAACALAEREECNKLILAAMASMGVPHDSPQFQRLGLTREQIEQYIDAGKERSPATR